MPRLFIAINLPAGIKKSLHHLARTIPHAKPVQRHQIHLTLKFLGDISDTETDNIQSYLKSISHGQFSMQILSVGRFPSKGKARVIWAGLSDPSDLIQLQKKIDLLTTPDNPTENYIPHITLARTHHSAKNSSYHNFLEENRSYSLPSFLISEFTLYSSKLTPNGAVHTPIQNYPLIKNNSS